MTDHAALDALVDHVRAAGISLDAPDTSARLARFVEEVRGWSARVNLISRRELDRIVEKHVGPSLAALAGDAPAPGDAACVVDIGSGGGFPGLVIAIARPAWRVHLIEPRRRKTLFLEHAAREAGNVTVWRCRADAGHDEPTLRGAADVVTSRAVAPPHEIWPLALPFLAPGGEVRVYVPRDAHDALAERLCAAHADVECLDPIQVSWWRGALLRARRAR